MRLTKRSVELPVESVLKHPEGKSFEQTVNRSYVCRGAVELRLPLADPVAPVIRANFLITRHLCLDGRPTDPLPDSPATPAPAPPA